MAAILIAVTRYAKRNFGALARDIGQTAQLVPAAD
jgi:hypothetical protein